MPEDKTVTITINDDGTIDLKKFEGDPDLKKVKVLVDRLRRENQNLRNSSDDDLAEQLQEAQTRIRQLERKRGLSPEQEQELAALREGAKFLESLGIKTKEDADRVAADLAFAKTTREDGTLKRVASLVGADEEAFLSLSGVRGLEFDVQRETVIVNDERQVRETPRVKVDGTWEPAKEYLQRTYSKFGSVLFPEGEGDKGKGQGQGDKGRDKNMGGLDRGPGGSGGSGGSGKNTTDDDDTDFFGAFTEGAAAR